MYGYYVLAILIAFVFEVIISAVFAVIRRFTVGATE